MTGKRKILLAAPVPPPYGGIANWTCMVQKYFEQDRENTLAGIVDISPHKRQTEGRTLWDRVVIQGFRMFFLRREMKRITEETAPDVFHMTTSGRLAVIRDILLIKTARKRKIPVVYHIHFGRIPEIQKKNTPEWKLLKTAVSLADKTVVIDKKSEEALLQSFDREKIIRILNPFDASRIQKKNRTETRTETRTVVFLGLCIREKGIEELLAAWDRICSDFPEWKLCLVGPYRQDYKRKMESLYQMNRVRWTGEQSHEEALGTLEQSSLFVLPSHTEGCPNAVLEAMAFSKAIIGTDVGAIEEMLENGCGLTVPPGNTEKLADALRLLMTDGDRRNRMGEKACERLKESYTIDIIFSHYAGLWKSLTENR